MSNNTATTLKVHRVVSNAGIGHVSYCVFAVRHNSGGADDEGEVPAFVDAAVVDPVADIALYLEAAVDAVFSGVQQRPVIRWQYVLLTHIPTDIVSGHLAFANATGATIVGSVNACGAASLLALGSSCPVAVLPTPGHTLDSCCFLVGGEHLFSGDTIAFDSIGVPGVLTCAAHDNDVAADQHSNKRQQSFIDADMARTHFRSLRRAIDPLGDGVVVHAGHTKGASLTLLPPFNATLEHDTLGAQRKSNFALAPGLTEAAFVAEVDKRIAMATPWCMGDTVRGNVAAPPPTAAAAGFRRQLLSSVAALEPAAFKKHVDAQIGGGPTSASGPVWVVDVRRNADFCASHVPGSIYIGADGSIELWASLLLRHHDRGCGNCFVLVVATPATDGDDDDDDDGKKKKDEEATKAAVNTVLRRFAHVGLTNCVGFLSGGVAAWAKAGYATASAADLSPADTACTYNAYLKKQKTDEAICYVDVRFPIEWHAAHVKGAVFHPLHSHFAPSIFGPAASLKCPEAPEGATATTLLSQCRGGYRSLIYISCEELLRLRRGDSDVAAKGPKLVNIAKGWAGLKELPAADQMPEESSAQKAAAATTASTKATAVAGSPRHQDPAQC